MENKSYKYYKDVFENDENADKKISDALKVEFIVQEFIDFKDVNGSLSFVNSVTFIFRPNLTINERVTYLIGFDSYLKNVDTKRFDKYKEDSEKFEAIFLNYDKLYGSIPKQFKTFEKKMAIEVGICMGLETEKMLEKQKKKSNFFK